LHSNRNFGLDVLRSIAIWLVIHSHMQPRLPFESRELTVIARGSAVLGVDIFFILSGFLIGRILFRELLSGGDDFTWVKLKIFYYRRWLRTLPLYYVVLLLLLLKSWLINAWTGWHQHYFVFLQNFCNLDQFVDIAKFDPSVSRAEMKWFGVAWSLSVEEWFYLLVPIALLLLIGRKPLLQLAILSSYIFLILIVKGEYAAEFQPTFNQGIRKVIPLRFDTLLIGVGAAFFESRFPKIFRALGWKITALISGIALYLWHTRLMNLYYTGWLFSPERSQADTSFLVFYFPILSLLMIPLLIFVSRDKLIARLGENKLLYTIFTYTSLYSYSIYLLHSQFLLFGEYLQANYPWLSPMLIWPGVIVLTYICCHFVYHYFEKPILDRRPKDLKAESISKI